MTHRVLVPLILTASLGVLAQAQDVEQPDPIASALHESSPEERRFHEHVTFLAHPALEGRLPGSTGSTLAESMIISTFEQLGLQPGFRSEDGSATHRQPFTFQQGGRFSDRSETRIVEGNNIGAVLPGTGSLSDRWIIIGAHHDHIGRGDFGSRRGRGEIHEGADDNASGTASLLLAAELLARSLQDREDGQADRRSLLFVTFSGEESGLNGSAHCAENLPMPFESVDLMINIDMIGRISEEAVSISGVDSGEGLATLLDGLVTTQGLDIRRPRGLSSRSDHAEFYRRGMPVLFMTESIFPDEYHTPDDESWLINNRDGAKASRLLHRSSTPQQHTPTRSRIGRSRGSRAATTDHPSRTSRSGSASSPATTATSNRVSPSPVSRQTPAPMMRGSWRETCSSSGTGNRSRVFVSGC